MTKVNAVSYNGFTPSCLNSPISKVTLVALGVLLIGLAIATFLAGAKVLPALSHANTMFLTTSLVGGTGLFITGFGTASFFIRRKKPEGNPQSEAKPTSQEEAKANKVPQPIQPQLPSQPKKANYRIVALLHRISDANGEGLPTGLSSLKEELGKEIKKIFDDSVDPNEVTLAQYRQFLTTLFEEVASYNFPKTYNESIQELRKNIYQLVNQQSESIISLENEFLKLLLSHEHLNTETILDYLSSLYTHLEKLYALDAAKQKFLIDTPTTGMVGFAHAHSPDEVKSWITTYITEIYDIVKKDEKNEEQAILETVEWMANSKFHLFSFKHEFSQHLIDLVKEKKMNGDLKEQFISYFLAEFQSFYQIQQQQMLRNIMTGIKAPPNVSSVFKSTVQAIYPSASKPLPEIKVIWD